MAAAQNMEQTLLDTDNSTKGKKLETTIHNVKPSHMTIRVAMIEALNEETEMKLSSFCVFLQQTEKRSDPGMCVLRITLTECDWQNGCCMWRMSAAVGISDMGDMGE